MVLLIFLSERRKSSVHVSLVLINVKNEKENAAEIFEVRAHTRSNPLIDIV